MSNYIEYYCLLYGMSASPFPPLGYFPVAYLNLGTSLIALGRCQEAASVLREGTKLDGSGLRDRAAHENARISALLQLGNLYADQGKLQRALAVYREALHTLPERYPPQEHGRETLCPETEKHRFDRLCPVR
uniref:TPR_REGION domain-containing protein n=1 Tax=Anopheles minimus TaxID=112268 RepID=A0A182WH00_9DIPT